MSETLTSDNPYDFGTPEWQQFEQGKRTIGKGIITSLSAAPGALAGLVVPDPKTGIPLTGAMAQLYGFGDLVSRAFTRNDPRTSVNGITPSEDETALLNETLTGKPTPDNVIAKPYDGVGLPFAHSVENALHRVEKRGMELLPPIHPDNAGERIGQEAVRAAASMGVPLPGKWLTNLPTATKAAVNLLNPAASGHLTPTLFGGGIGTVVGAAQEADNAATPTPNLAPTVTQTSIGPATNTPSLQPTNGFNIDLSKVNLNDELDQIIHASPDSHLTWKDAAIGAATLGAIVLGHKIATHTMGSAVEAARRVAYESNTAYRDHQAGRLAGTIGPGTPAPEVPLPPRNVSPVVPDSVAQTSLKARTAAVDENSGINAFNNFHTPNENVAQDLRAQWGTLGNKGYVNERIKHIAETGFDPTSGVSMPSHTDAAMRISKFDDVKKKLLNDAEYSADELDNRTRLQNNQGAVGLANPSGTRVAFSDYTDAQLRKFVADGYADPDVAFELHENTIRNARMVDLLKGSGLIDAQTAATLKTLHPNYLPTADLAGIIENPLKARDLTIHSGVDSSVIPSWELRKQHFESIIRAREHNIVLSNTVQNALDSQARNPRLPKMFEPSLDTSGPTPKYVQKDGSIGYRVNGELRWVNVNNSGLRLALSHTPAMSSELIKAAAIISNISRSGTTQALAALLGIPFSAKNAIRMTTRMGIARPQGTYSGYLDRTLQQATGGRVGLPGGLDPTMYTAPFVGTAQNLYGLQVHALSNLLRGGADNPFNRVLRSMFGDTAIDAQSQRIMHAYERSTRGQMVAAGATNSTGLSAAEVPTAQLAARNQIASPLNATAPELYMIHGPTGEAGAKFVRLNNMFHELLNAVGESTHTFYFGLNKNNPALVQKYGYEGAQRMNAFNTRQLGGDVGQRGNSSLLRDYGSISKYTNVMIQDWANLTDAMAKAPFQTALNYFTTVGVLALASIYTAMLHGPEAINHLFNELSNDQRAANIHFYIPGQAPEDSPTMPISQTDRFGVTPVLQLFADISNLQAHGTNDPYYEWFKNGLEDLFAKHITEATLDSSMAGLKSATEIPLPDALQTGIAATGNRGVFNPIDMLAPSDKPIGQRLTVPLGGGAPQLPGFTNDRDVNAGAVTGSMFWNVIGAVLGAAGSAVHQSIQLTANRYEATHDPMEALAAFGNSYKARLQSSLPIGRGVLWSAPEQLSLRSPLAESVNHAAEVYRPLISAKSDMTNEGLTRRKGMVVDTPVNGEQKLPTDPIMLNLYLTASKQASQLLTTKNAPIKEADDWKKMIGALANSGRTQEEIIALRNQYTRELHTSLERAADQINDGNLALSKIVGKPIDIRKIDWHKGPEQFTDPPH